jgi:hypothetical protein
MSYQCLFCDIKTFNIMDHKLNDDINDTENNNLNCSDDAIINRDNDEYKNFLCDGLKSGTIVIARGVWVDDD